MRLLNQLRKTDENSRIVLVNIGGAFFVKGLALVISLLTTPAYIRFFNDNSTLGLWFTLLSVLNWILNFDLGIGNGLRNHLTRTLTNGDRIESKKYISSAYISITVLCLIIGLAFSCAFQFLNWNKILNIENNIVNSDSLRIAITIVFIGIVVQLILRQISSILYALQKSSVNNFLNLCTSVLTYLAVIIIPSGDNDSNLIVMAVIHALAVMIPLLLTTFILFSKEPLRDSRPSFRYFSKKHMNEVLSLGGIFFFVQILYMIIMSTNEYMITFMSESANVVDYNIYNKLFTLGGTIFALAMTPIWSIVTKALTERNIDWLQKLYKKLLLLASIVSLCEFAVVPFLQPIIDIWLGDEAIAVDSTIGIVFAILGSSMIFNSVLSSFANGMGKLKIQTFCFLAGAVLKLPVAMVLVRVTGSWIGVVMSNVVAMVPYCVIQPIGLRKYMNNKGVRV